MKLRDFSKLNYIDVKLILTCLFFQSRTFPCWGALCTRAECLWTWCTSARRCVSPTTSRTWGMRSKCFSNTVEERTCVFTRACSMREVSVRIWLCVLNECDQGRPKPVLGPKQNLILGPPTSADTTDYCLLVIHTPTVNSLNSFISFYDKYTC